MYQIVSTISPCVCKRCHKDSLCKLVDVNYICNRKCKKCVNWEFFNDPYKLLVSPVPANLPVDSNLLKDGNLYPQKISGPVLLAGYKATHSNVSDGTWSRKGGEAYLTVMGLNEIFIEKFLDHSQNMYFMSNIDSVKTEHQNYYYQLMKESPEKFEPYPLPKVWFPPFGIETFVDAPMHLLFHGIVKDVNRLTLDWLSAFGIKSKVLQSFSKYFGIIFDMKLEWIKVIPIGEGSFSGLVIENWMGLCRILKWMYSIISHIYPFASEVKDPVHIPVSRWNGDHYKNWLKKRGLAQSGTVAVLREKVIELMESSDCPIPISARSGGGIDCLEVLWILLHAVVSNSMTGSVDTSVI